LLIAGATAIGGSAVVAISTATSPRTAGLPFDPVASVYVAWLEYPVLAVGILGALSFTSEYASGLVRTTFASVPRRVAVLAAKASVTGAVVLAFGEVVAFASFLLSAAILSGRHSDLSLSRAGEARAVLAGGFCLFVVALVGLGLGAITRHTAGAVAALPAVVYLPLVVLSLPSPWNDDVGRFTLLVAAYQLVSGHPQAGLLSVPLSFLVLVAWPAVILVTGGVFLTRRDA
jgi:hypothetical protein